MTMLGIPDDVLDSDRLPGADVRHDEQQQSRVDDLGRRLRRPFGALSGVPNLPVYAGLGLIVLGVLLLLVAWGRTAAVHNVALQVPYVVSAGFTGLAVVAVGLKVVAVAAQARDAAARREQLSELQQLLAAVRAAVEEGKR